MGKITVIGSSNTDMVINTTNFPVPGETILGGTFFTNAGGKGANQAVAASRLAGDVFFIARLGNDLFGKQALESFRQEGIQTDFIVKDGRNPSGVALITVNSAGENTIVVAAGSNGFLSTEDILAAEEAIGLSDIMLIQLEIPYETVEFAVALGKKHAKKVILNPAPMCGLSDELLRDLYLITPNKSETEKISGIKIERKDDAVEAAKFLHSKGVKNSIITLGKDGCYIHGENYQGFLPAPTVAVKDTTAAGDIFNGALATALADGKELKEAAEFAVSAASFSVTKAGAQSSAPTLNDLHTHLTL